MKTTTRKSSYVLTAQDAQGLRTQLNQVLARIGQRLDRMEGVGQNPDLHGSTLTNVGPAARSTDAARKDQLDTAVDRVTVIGGAGNIRAGVGISVTDGATYQVIALKQQTDVPDVTSASVTDPADAPVDADALREDLVSNVIPSIESAFNGITGTVNEILSRLRGSEVIG